jgi:hypothetical protein
MLMKFEVLTAEVNPKDGGSMFLRNAGIYLQILHDVTTHEADIGGAIWFSNSDVQLNILNKPRCAKLCTDGISRCTVFRVLGKLKSTPSYSRKLPAFTDPEGLSPCSQEGDAGRTNKNSGNNNMILTVEINPTKLKSVGHINF